MQFSGPVRVVPGSAFVEFLYVVSITGITGTFEEDDELVFGSGAEGVLVAIEGGLYVIAITTEQQPVALDTVETDDADGTVSAFDTAPDLFGAAIESGALFIRDGDQVAYLLSAVPSRSRIQLSTPYGGVASSGTDSDGIIHSTRTPVFGLPSFDRRDRNLTVLLNELVLLLENALVDHENRIEALEP